jgi:hypothetical protein
MPNDLVHVDISHERIFKNITDHSEPFEGTFAVDEWGFTTRSKVEACSISINDDDIKEGGEHPDYAGKKDAIGMKTGSVTVKSGGTVKAVTKGSEIHRNNGELHMQFSYPSINPIVRVDIPDGLDHSCTFGIPGEKIIRSHISKQYRLDGTQFPGQHTRLRWWPS